MFLKWVFERCAGRAEAVLTPIGELPAPGAIDLDGLEISPEDISALLEVDPEQWRGELDPIGNYYAEFADRLPAAMSDQLEGLRKRLG